MVIILATAIIVRVIMHPEDSETSRLMSTNFSIGHIGELQLLIQSRGCANATGEEAEEKEEEEEEEQEEG